MIKNTQYFKELNLGHAAIEIAKLGSDRGNCHEIFGDAVHALLILSEDRVVTSEEIRHVLGEPDELNVLDVDREIWVYHWIGQHGPSTYSSSTPIGIANGICIGLART